MSNFSPTWTQRETPYGWPDLLLLFQWTCLSFASATVYLYGCREVGMYNWVAVKRLSSCIKDLYDYVELSPQEVKERLPTVGWSNSHLFAFALQSIWWLSYGLLLSMTLLSLMDVPSYTYSNNGVAIHLYYYLCKNKYNWQYYKYCTDSSY